MPFIWVICFLVFTPAFCTSGVLSVVPSGEITISSLSIGKVADFRKAFGSGIEISNTFPDPVQVQAWVSLDGLPFDTGYKSVPDKGWISIDKQYFFLQPGEKASENFFIRIPDDSQYLGQKYHFKLNLSAMNAALPETVSVLVNIEINRFRINVFDLIDEMNIHPDFEILPEQASARVSAGKPRKMVFQLRNRSEQKYMFRLKADNYLSFENDTVTVPAGQARDFYAVLLIPDNPANLNRQFNLRLSAEISGQEPVQKKYAGIAVRTEEEK